MKCGGKSAAWVKPGVNAKFITDPRPNRPPHVGAAHSRRGTRAPPPTAVAGREVTWAKAHLAALVPKGAPLTVSPLAPFTFRSARIAVPLIKEAPHQANRVARPVQVLLPLPLPSPVDAHVRPRASYTPSPAPAPAPPRSPAHSPPPPPSSLSPGDAHARPRASYIPRGVL